MTVQSRTILKGYFNTGDIPSEQNYADLIDSMYHVEEGSSVDKTIVIVSGSTATSGNLTLVSAPAGGSRIVVTWAAVQNESSSGSNMFTLRDGTAEKFRYLAVNQGNGLGIAFPTDSRWKLTAGSALVLNLSAARTTGYTIAYYTE